MSDKRTHAVIQALIEQRNSAMNNLAELTGLIAERDEKITELFERLREAEETAQNKLPIENERDELRVFYELNTGKPYVFPIIGDLQQEAAHP